MVSIKRFCKNNWKILSIIIICELFNLLFFYHQGILDEFAQNGMYLKYISDFPASISDVRVEPLFITILYLFAKLIGSPIIAIAILKNVIIVLQLYFFYLNSKLLLKNKNLAYFGSIMLNFSFAFFSIAQNLLRNHLANLFLLICIYYLLKLLREKNITSWKELIISRDFTFCIIAGGLLIYSHILPSLIILFSLFAFALLLFWIFCFANSNRQPKSNYKLFISIVILSILLVNNFTINYLIFAVISLVICSIIWKQNLLKNLFSNNLILFLALINAIFFEFDKSLPLLIVFFLNFGLAFNNLFIITFAKEKIKSFEGKMPLIKSITVLSGIFFLQVPYIIRLLLSRTGTGDYSEAGKYIGSPSIIAPIESTRNLIADIFLTLEHESISNFIKAFRIFFEYRLSSISIFLMLLTFIAILYIFKKNKVNYLFIFCFWLVAYIGSKVDLLFGIGVLSFRFSLMLIFPTILLLLILLDHFSDFYNRKIKLLIFSLITISFLSLNLPNIFGISIFKDFNIDKDHQNDLSQIYNEDFKQYSDKQTVVYYNGDSFSSFDDKSSYINNATVFSSNNENDIINSFKKVTKVFIIYDKKLINISGNDIGSKINSNINVYETSNNFKKIGDFLTKNTNLSIFEYDPSDVGKKNSQTTFDLPNQTEDLNSFLEREKNNITVWNVDIKDNGKDSSVLESISLKDHRIALITYNLKDDFGGILYNNNNIKLFPIGYRPPFNLNIHISDAIISFPNSSINDLKTYLEEYSVNELRIYGKTNITHFSYSYLNRIQIKLLSGFIGFVVFIIVFFIIFGYNIKSFYTATKGIKDIRFANKSKILLLIFCLASLADLLFLNTIIYQCLKKLLNL